VSAECVIPQWFVDKSVLCLTVLFMSEPLQHRRVAAHFSQTVIRIVDSNHPDTLYTIHKYLTEASLQHSLLDLHC